MAAMWTLLSVFLCLSAVSAEDEACATCGQSPPAQSAALLQSSVQRHAKPAGEPRMFSPAQFFGPGAKGHHMQKMARMSARMGPHMGPHRKPQYNLEQQSRGESLYDSTYGGSEVTPCKTPASWMGDKLLYGWCDTWQMPVQPDEATCNAADGCRYSWGYCNCETDVGCSAVGGAWTGTTCRSQLEMLMPEDLDKIKEAQETGTCENVASMWGTLKDLVAGHASQCCSDYPNTLCEPVVQAMNPCKDQDDFTADGYAYAWCDLYGVEPSKDTCDATPGCKEDYGWCNCRTKAGCDALGGYFQGETCASQISYWYPGIHKAVKEALDKQTCQGVEGPWGDIKYSVDYIGFACCGSGKSMCEELDNYDSGYSQYY